MSTISDPRKMAIERRDQASREVARWTEFLAMYDELEATPNADSGVSPAETLPSTGHTLPQRKPTPTGKSVVALGTAKAARKLILASNRPLLTREVLAQLQATGHEVGGKDPKATLFSRLVRAPHLLRFEKDLGWTVVTERVLFENPKQEAPPVMEAPPE